MSREKLEFRRLVCVWRGQELLPMMLLLLSTHLNIQQHSLSDKLHNNEQTVYRPIKLSDILDLCRARQSYSPDKQIYQWNRAPLTRGGTELTRVPYEWIWNWNGNMPDRHFCLRGCSHRSQRAWGSAASIRRLRRWFSCIKWQSNIRNHRSASLSQLVRDKQWLATVWQ